MNAEVVLGAGAGVTVPLIMIVSDAEYEGLSVLTVIEVVAAVVTSDADARSASASRIPTTLTLPRACKSNRPPISSGNINRSGVRLWFSSPFPEESLFTAASLDGVPLESTLRCDRGKQLGPSHDT